MTVLTIIQNACAVLSLPRPPSAVNSPAAQAQTLVGLSQIGGRTLAQAHPWQMLTKRITFPGVAQVAQTGQPPAPYNRFAPVQRIWDETRRTWLIGPLSTDQWDGVIVKGILTSPSYWCMLGGLINIYPAPTPADSFTYTLISKNWIRPNGGAADGSDDIQRWNADSDEPLIEDSLLELDLIWRFKQSKGLDYAEDMNTFERAKELAIARDRGPRSITTTQPDDYPPDFWPGIIGVDAI